MRVEGFSDDETGYGRHVQPRTAFDRAVNFNKRSIVNHRASGSSYFA